MLNRSGLGLEPHLLLSSHEFALWSQGEKFDAIIVDHGPEMRTRRDDLPWITRRLKPTGCLILDDFHLNHEHQCRRVLSTLGSWTIKISEPSPTSGDSKPIGFAKLISRQPNIQKAPQESSARGPHRGRKGRR
jgi:hypothetical protein